VIQTIDAAKGRWITLDERPRDPAIEARCTREFLQGAIGKLGDLTVVSANLITNGKYDVPPIPFDLGETMAPFATLRVIEDLPAFCDVTIDLRGAGGHVSTITVWVPLNWNGRFFGTTGGGTRTMGWLSVPEAARAINLPTALRNGFATARTNGGVKDRRNYAWGLDFKTGEVDRELTDLWIHRATHEMTVIGKAVTQAIHGVAPKYSYLCGTSGGGRQTLVEAQRYPGDYDGLWASDAAFRWTKMLLAELWPALVMKESGVALAPGKLNAFREAAIEACDGLDGLRDGIIGAFDPCDFDPRQIVGQSTSDGPITEADAEVMAKIWQGPRKRNGEFMWWGVHPGTRSWGTDEFPAGLLCSTALRDGKREPIPFEVADAYVQCWVAKDPNWDFRKLTYEKYEELFEKSVREYPELSSDDPDLRALRDRGGKLIISQGANDQVIPFMGAVDYYRNVTRVIGSEDETRSFARLFVTEGDGHNIPLDPGPGLYAADVLAALMRWVEEGKAPDEITAKTLNPASSAVKAERPAYAYPFVPEYRGAGDPNKASSFKPVRFETRTRR